MTELEGADGTVAPTCRQGKRYQMPPPFRRLSGMLPASTEKKTIGIYRWKCVKYYPKMREFPCNYLKILQLLGDFVPRPPTGAPPLDPPGRLPSPRPLWFCPIPNLLPPPMVTIPNFTAVCQGVWAYVGFNLGVLGPRSVGRGRGWPLDTCFSPPVSPTCITVPNLVILGQTVRA